MTDPATVDVQPALVFKNLTIRRNYNEQLVGTISFSSAHADITLNLTEEHVKQMLSVAGTALVESAREVAELLVHDCIIAKAEVSAIEMSGSLKALL